MIETTTKRAVHIELEHLNHMRGGGAGGGMYNVYEVDQHGFRVGDRRPIGSLQRFWDAEHGAHTGRWDFDWAYAGNPRYTTRKATLAALLESLGLAQV